MALIIEDGSVVADADSFITEAEADTILAKYGKDTVWTTKSSAEKEVLLLTAGSYLNTKPKWCGCIVELAQTMIWPRVNMYKCGFLIGSDTVPEDIKRAQAFMAEKAIANSIFRDVDPGVNGQKLIGDMNKLDVLETEKTYSTKSAKNGSQIIFTEVNCLLKPYTQGGGTRSIGRS
jgi:hypothetical protein